MLDLSSVDAGTLRDYEMAERRSRKKEMKENVQTEKDSIVRCKMSQIRPKESSSLKSRIDIAIVCATIIYPKSCKPPELLLIKQFRPPLNCESVEFVAGLCDIDESPEETACREVNLIAMQTVCMHALS